jgi:hypothetical protein
MLAEASSIENEERGDAGLTNIVGGDGRQVSNEAAERGPVYGVEKKRGVADNLGPLSASRPFGKHEP